MKTVAYLRVSTDKQELETQKMKILEYANKEGIHGIVFDESIISTRKQKQIDHFADVVSSLDKGDLLIVADLLRTGRSLEEIIRQMNRIIKKKIDFVSLKENIKIKNGEQDLATKMLIYQFGMLGELERDLISIRTKERLELARSRGAILGRPKGATGKSKLDGKDAEIKGYLEKKLSKASIGRLFGVSATTVKHYIKSRDIKA